MAIAMTIHVPTPQPWLPHPYIMRDASSRLLPVCG